jgi:sodium/proline symporter
VQISPATLTTFFIYVVAMFAIAWVAYKRTHNLGDYLLGGRKLSAPVAALSAGASDMSGWLLLGLPGAVYLGGLGESWIVFGLVFGAWLNWTLVAKPLRIATESYGSLTLPDYLTARFDDRGNLLRLVSAVVILLFFTFYAASGLVAGALLFSSTFGLSYYSALFLGAVVIVGYTMIGGFLAVSWTDMVQGLLMLLALVVVPLVMLYELGGLSSAIEQLERIDPKFLLLNDGMGFIGIASLLAWGLGYFGQPHILTRFMAIESPEKVPTARWVAMSWMVIVSVAALAVGLIGMAYLNHIGLPLADKDSEKVFIFLTQIVFNPWVGGVLLAAILAAIMSTIDSQLLVSSSALSEDFYKTLINPSATDKQLMMVGRLTVLVISIVAVGIALDPTSKVLGLVSYAWAGLGASFGPVILLSLYYRNMSKTAALAGMVTGAVTVVVWKQLDGGIFELYELLPAFCLASIAIPIVTQYTSTPESVTSRFDRALSGS